MNRPRHPTAQQSAHLHLNKIRFTIVPHKWSVVVLMLHEMNVDAVTLREALETGHGIVFDPADDPELWFVLDSEMRKDGLISDTARPRVTITKDRDLSSNLRRSISAHCRKRLRKHTFGLGRSGRWIKTNGFNGAQQKPMGFPVVPRKRH